MAKPTFFIANGSDDAYGVPIRVNVSQRGDLSNANLLLSNSFDVLIADGASPTQAHVNSAFALYSSLSNLIGSDITIMVNTSTITNANQLKAALDKFLQHMKGTGLITAG